MPKITKKIEHYNSFVYFCNDIVTFVSYIWQGIQNK